MPVKQLKMDAAAAQRLARLATLLREEQGQVLMRGVAVLEEIERQKLRGKRAVFVRDERLQPAAAAE